MRIQILAIEGCPHVEAAHSAVEQALALAGISSSIEHITVREALFPGFAGSPTILIDGRDVEPDPGGCAGIGCRIYANAANRGVPTLESIVRAFANSRGAEQS